MNTNTLKSLFRLTMNLSLITNPIAIFILLMVPMVDIIGYTMADFDTVTFIVKYYDKPILDVPYLIYAYIALISLLVCSYAVLCMILNKFSYKDKQAIVGTKLYNLHIVPNSCCILLLVISLIGIPTLVIPTHEVYNYLNNEFDSAYGKYTVATINHQRKSIELTNSQKVQVMKKAHEIIDNTNIPDENKTNIDIVIDNITRISRTLKQN